MEISPVASHLIVGLIGVLVGASGSYFADKFTDRRRQLEKKSNLRESWNEISARMPDLISEMKKDWSKPEHQMVRRFSIIHEGMRPEGPGVSLVYFHEQHPQLEDKIIMLENHDFIELEEIEGQIKTYRVSETFLKFLIKG